MLLDHQVQSANRDQEANLVRLASKVHLAKQGRRALQEIVVQLECRASKENVVTQGRKAFPARQVKLGLEVSVARQACLDQLVLVDRREALE